MGLPYYCGNFDARCKGVGVNCPCEYLAPPPKGFKMCCPYTFGGDIVFLEKTPEMLEEEKREMREKEEKQIELCIHYLENRGYVVTKKEEQK